MPERLAERILFLKGEVEMVPGQDVEKITEPAEMLKKAAEMETSAQEMYNDFRRAIGRERRLGHQAGVRGAG